MDGVIFTDVSVLFNITCCVGIRLEAEVRIVRTSKSNLHRLVFMHRMYVETDSSFFFRVGQSRRHYSMSSWCKFHLPVPRQQYNGALKQGVNLSTQIKLGRTLCAQTALIYEDVTKKPTTSSYLINKIYTSCQKAALPAQFDLLSSLCRLLK